jgi:hypothetical protein
MMSEGLAFLVRQTAGTRETLAAANYLGFDSNLFKTLIHYHLVLHLYAI